MTNWRHKRRGMIYEVVTEHCSLQCSAAREFERMFDDDSWTVYRNVATGMIYVRPTKEFMDGRFELIPEEAA